VTLPYVFRVAQNGLRKALRQDPALRLGVNVHDGLVVHPAVAESQGLAHHPVENLFS
jgi:alanine dehydrogenase